MATEAELEREREEAVPVAVPIRAELMPREPATTIAVLERGPPILGEMVPTYWFGCPTCKTRFSSYHSVTTLQQIMDMCPSCNSLGQSLKRVQVNDLASEFAAEFVLCHASDLDEDPTTKWAAPVPADRKWSIIRPPISVRKKYGFNLGMKRSGERRRIGFGPLIVRIGLDAGDRHIMGEEKVPPKVAEARDQAVRSQYEGTFILRTYLRYHNKSVAWNISEKWPIKAYDSDNKSPYEVEFPYYQNMTMRSKPDRQDLRG